MKLGDGWQMLMVTEEQDHEYLENSERYQKMSENRPPKTCSFYVYKSQRGVQNVTYGTEPKNHFSYIKTIIPKYHQHVTNTLHSTKTSGTRGKVLYKYLKHVF